MADNRWDRVTVWRELMPLDPERAEAFYQSVINHRFLVWFSHYGIPTLRIGFGILFLWLGLLKVVPGVSPAEPLMRASMPTFLPIDAFIRFSAVWEIIVGVGFLSNRFPRVTLAMTFCTMLVTLSILWMAPDHVWRRFPLLLTFEGQYVVKDIVIASAGLVLAATLRGRQLALHKRATQSMIFPAPRLGLLGLYDRLEARLVRWLARYSPALLRLSFATVFLWYGTLNLDPATSPVTAYMQSFVPGEAGVNQLRILGVVDIIIGIGVLTNRARTLVYVLAILFLIYTFVFSLLNLPGTFRSFPLILTLEGQYTLKNLIFLGAAMVLGVTSQGGGLSRTES